MQKDSCSQGWQACPGSQGGSSALKSIHLQSFRRPGLVTVALLTAWLLVGVFCLPAAASEKSLPADWSAAKPEVKDHEAFFQAGGGPTLSLLYLDVDVSRRLKT